MDDGPFLDMLKTMLDGSAGPEPGPEGSHADFYKPLGQGRIGQRWVVSLHRPYEDVIAGPFDSESEAARWADEHADGANYMTHPLDPPEDWPPSDRDPVGDPPDPDLPLFSPEK